MWDGQGMGFQEHTPPKKGYFGVDTVCFAPAIQDLAILTTPASAIHQDCHFFLDTHAT